MKILVIHGPNLNILGEREPEIYGKLSLKEINIRIREFAKQKGVSLKIIQSNSEGEIINTIQQERKWAEGLIINPGTYTHYSYAIFDTIIAVGIPAVEVHLSNIYKREEWRRKSVIAPACKGQICGFGWRSYILGIEALLSMEI